MNKPGVQSCMPTIDLESYSAISEILKECEGGRADIDIMFHLRRFAQNISLMLNYGTRITPSSDKLLKEIVEVEGAIARFRSTSNNWQDYVPLLRLFPAKSNNTNSYRLRRDRYLQHFLNGLKQDIANGTDRPCIIGNILKDPATKINEAEMRSICLSMVGGGLDVVAASIILGIGYLSSLHGQEIQERAYAEIQKPYPDGDAWRKCLVEERVPYVTALYKEILRHYTIFPMSVPRRSVEDIEYNGIIIPAGTTFYMNAFASNHDEDHFKDPNTFNPDRYLGDTIGTPHYTYGAVSRICVAAHLVNQELFIFFIRLIIAFRILEPENKKDAAVLDAIEVSKCPTALTLQPKPCKCRFEARNKVDLDCWLESSRRRTDNY